MYIMHNNEWEDIYIWAALLHLLFINTMIKYDNCVQLCCCGAFLVCDGYNFVIKA